MKTRKKQLIQLMVMVAALVMVWLWKDSAWLVIVVVCTVYIGIDGLSDHLQKRRIQKIYQEIDKVLSGDYSVMMSDYEEGAFSILQNEIHKLVIRLNEQALELKEDKRYLMDAMADISHQLKTPLTSMNILLSFLMEEHLSYEERLKLLGKLNTSLRHVEWLIATLLKLSKFDADTVSFQKVPVMAEQLINEAQERLEISFELKQISFEKQIQEKTSFTGDRQWTLEAVENILKNCMEHTPEGGHIFVTASENAIYTEFLICDDGAGIAPEDISHIFERFYRGKNADAQSVGIGLALAAEIVHRQNGTILVRNGKEGGAEFVIRFYKMLP